MFGLTGSILVSGSLSAAGRTEAVDDLNDQRQLGAEMIGVVQCGSRDHKSSLRDRYVDLDLIQGEARVCPPRIVPVVRRKPGKSHGPLVDDRVVWENRSQGRIP